MILVRQLLSGALHKPAMVVVGITTLVVLMLFIVSGPWGDDVVQSEILRGDAKLYGVITGEASWTKVDPQAQRLPGYPLFIAMIRLVSGGGLWAVFLVQGAIHVATTWFIFKIGTLLTDSKTSGIAALLYGTSILAGWYAVHELFSETVFTFFVVVAIFIAARMIKKDRQSTRDIILLGVVIGITVWIRTRTSSTRSLVTISVV